MHVIKMQDLHVTKFSSTELNKYMYSTKKAILPLFFSFILEYFALYKEHKYSFI